MTTTPDGPAGGQSCSPDLWTCPACGGQIHRVADDGSVVAEWELELLHECPPLPANVTRLRG